MTQMHRALNSQPVSANPFGFYANTTPFPNYLLDDVMPALTDTEWRLLCVVVRQTLGWQEKGGQRKTWDWMTNGQLRRHTGRASGAVCKALDVLVQCGLVEVRDETGQPLPTPAVRRRYGGKIFFRLGAATKPSQGVIAEATAPNVVTAGEKQQNRSGTEIEKKAPANTRLATSDKPFPQSEIRKAKTTKETQTKEEKATSVNRKGSVMEDQIQTASEAARFTQSVQESVPLAIDEKTMKFIKAYQEQYKTHFPQRQSPSVSDIEAKNIQKISGVHSHEALLELLKVFFTCNLNHIDRRNHTLNAFTSNLPILKILSRSTRKMSG